MKHFRKNQEGLFICEECNQLFVQKENLVRHINKNHQSIKEYCDKWRKEAGDGICQTCGNETDFHKGEYRIFCSTKCAANNKKLTKIKKNTKIEKYGDENYVNPEKAKKTNLDIWGCTCTLYNRDINKKVRNTILKNLGCEYPMQNKQLFESAQKKAFWSKEYKGINYRGSYELDFLEKYQKIFPNIINGPTIRYQYKGKNKIYYPDFLIPSLNLIIEIKNSYLYQRDIEKIKEKEKATIANGFNYILVIDKNYDKLQNILNISAFDDGS
jgi:uncharacterized C2H2 Zn-finger protein